MLIILIALLGEIFLEYKGVHDLAAIFGGWITAVLGFYFLQQKVEQAQRREGEALDDAAKAKIDAINSKGKQLRTITSAGGIIVELQKQISEQSILIGDLIRKLEEIEGALRTRGWRKE